MLQGYKAASTEVIFLVTLLEPNFNPGVCTFLIFGVAVCLSLQNFHPTTPSYAIAVSLHYNTTCITRSSRASLLISIPHALLRSDR